MSEGVAAKLVFLNCADFPFVECLERRWLAAREEFLSLPRDCLIPWPERSLYDGGWDVFGLYAFGRRLDENCARCPRTRELVESVPGMTTAGFSVLAASARITPHVGYSKAVLRCHLGLVVPDGCALRVAGEVREWQEGRCLIFDDTLEHEAWNQGSSPRAALLIDFRRARQPTSRAPNGSGAG